jgi:hypothetical protein
MIYERVIGTVFRLDTEEKHVWINGDDYHYASDAESTLMEAIENDLDVSALIYYEHCESGCKLLRAQIFDVGIDDKDDDDTANDPLLEKA